MDCLFAVKKLKKGLFAFSFLAISLLATKTSNANMYVNAGIGTTGISVGTSYYYKNLIGVRAEYNFVPKAISGKLDNTIVKLDDEIIDANSKFQSYGFDLSVRPFFGSFRIDVGVRNMDIGFGVKGYEAIENDHYNDVGVYGKTHFRIAKGWKPYFGIGWDFNPILGLTLSFDIGAVYTGKWKMDTIDLDINYGSLSNNEIQEFNTDYADEIAEAKQDVADIQRKVNDKIPSFLQFYPVIKFSIGYQFDFF